MIICAIQEVISRHNERTLIMFWSTYYDMKLNSQLRTLDSYIQHGDTSCLLHSVAVAYYSMRISEKLGIRVDKSALIRGALLHDYFLYDWHDKKPERRIHGFTHPKKAFCNAERDFELSQLEGDIIKRHMFPLTPIPPKYRESVIVCFVDKICSLYETYVKNTYINLRNRI